MGDRDNTIMSEQNWIDKFLIFTGFKEVPVKELQEKGEIQSVELDMKPIEEMSQRIENLEQVIVTLMRLVNNQRGLNEEELQKLISSTIKENSFLDEYDRRIEDIKSLDLSEQLEKNIISAYEYTLKPLIKDAKAKVIYKKIMDAKHLGENLKAQFKKEMSEKITIE